MINAKSSLVTILQYGERYWFEHINVCFLVHFIPLETGVRASVVLPLNILWLDSIFFTQRFCQKYKISKEKSKLTLLHALFKWHKIVAPELFIW